MNSNMEVNHAVAVQSAFHFLFTPVSLMIMGSQEDVLATDSRPSLFTSRKQ